MVETAALIIHLNYFNFKMFILRMCILSGCDYLESLPGIGLGKAKKLFKTVQKSEIDHVSLS